LGKLTSERKINLHFNAARDDVKAVTSTGPHADYFHLAHDRLTTTAPRNSDKTDVLPEVKPMTLKL